VGVRRKGREDGGPSLIGGASCRGKPLYVKKKKRNSQISYLWGDTLVEVAAGHWTVGSRRGGGTKAILVGIPEGGSWHRAGKGGLGRRVGEKS